MARLMSEQINHGFTESNTPNQLVQEFYRMQGKISIQNQIIEALEQEIVYTKIDCGIEFLDGLERAIELVKKVNK